MAFLRELPEQLLAVWGRLGLSARVGLIAATVFVVAIIAAVGVWSSRPQFIPLASGLAPTETAEIVSQLDAKGIRHQLNFSGSSVLVPKSEWNQARLLVDEAVLETSASGWNDAMLGDPEMNHFRILRRREESLGRTLRRMAAVVKATVHIAEADRSPFIQEQQPTTASVVLELRSAASFTREQAASVVALVAGSVEGLDPEDVSVMDTRGRLLSSPNGFADADVSGQFEYRRRIETDLATKAHVMLAQLLGEGRAMVRVSADVDFTRLERTETTYDPDLKVRATEKISNIQETSESAPGNRARLKPSGAVGGVAGTGSNLTAAAGGRNTPYKKTEETNETTFENGQTVDIVKQAPGKIQRLTVAVMADLSPLESPAGEGTEAEGATAAATASPVTKENVESIVKQAVGFDPQRGDAIEVLITRFAAPTQDQQELLLVQKWDFYNKLVRNGSLGLAACVALILGLLTLRKMRPVTIRIAEIEDQEDRGKLLAEISERIQENPDAIRDIVSSWLDESDQRDDTYPRAA